MKKKKTIWYWHINERIGRISNFLLKNPSLERNEVSRKFRDFGWWTDANGYKHMEPYL